jgi:hypothetical protein
VIAVYPGATRDAGQSTSIRDGGDVTKVDYYNTKDDGPAVAAWYKAHVPPGWDSNMGEPGKKIAGTFSSPDQNQIVMVTGDASGTVIQISAKVASK